MPLDSKSLKTLRDKHRHVLAAGGEKKLQERREKGLLSARERLTRLFTPDTFQEFGTYVRHTCTAFGMGDKELPADGVIVGTGYVNGRQVAAFSHALITCGPVMNMCALCRVMMIQSISAGEYDAPPAQGPAMIAELVNGKV